MNKMFANTLVFLGLAAAVASAPMAQTPKPAAPGAQSQQGERQHRAFSKPSERVEARLAYIKTALKITDAQQSQWDAYASALRKQAAAGDKQMEEWRANRSERTERQPMSAIDRLERQQQLLTAAAARLSERLVVQKPLYAALSAEQKQVADRVLSPRGRHGGFRQRGHDRA